jgi:hypothetical protein
MKGDMIGLFERMGWALEARGLSPPAKLVLILAADKSDCECRCKTDGLADKANMTDRALGQMLDELAKARMARRLVVDDVPMVELLVAGGGE